MGTIYKLPRKNLAFKFKLDKLEEREFSHKIRELDKISSLIRPFYNELFKLLMLNKVNDKKDFIHWCNGVVLLINKVSDSRLFPSIKLFSPLIESNYKTVIGDTNLINQLKKHFGNKLPESPGEFGRIILKSVRELTDKGELKYNRLIEKVKKDQTLNDEDIVNIFLAKIKYLVLILTKQINPLIVGPWDKEIITKKINWKIDISLTSRELEKYVESIEDSFGS